MQPGTEQLAAAGKGTGSSQAPTWEVDLQMMQCYPEGCQSCVAGLHRMQWSALSFPTPVYRTVHIVLYCIVLNALKCMGYITGIGPCACSTEHDPFSPCMQYNTLLVLCFAAAVPALTSLYAVQHISGVVLYGCSTEHDQPHTQCMQDNTLPPFCCGNAGTMLHWPYTQCMQYSTILAL